MFLLLIFGLPSLLKNEPPIEPAAITVELLPITSITNVKPKEGTLAEPKKPDEPEKPKEQKKPAPPVKTAESTPPPPKPEQKPEPQKPEPKPEPKKPEPVVVEKKPEEKKPEPKKEEKPKEDIKKKAKEEDLDAILKAVKDTAQKEKKPEKTKDSKEKPSDSSKAISNQFDPNQAMSMSEKDAIMSQLAKCWTPPAGAKDAQNLVVVINADFSVDGGYVKAEIAAESRSRYNSDSFYRSAAESALRAIRQCSPLKNLPPEKYDTWKSMELHFDPREMLL